MTKDVIADLINLRRKLTPLLNGPQHATVRNTLAELDIEIENLEMAINTARGKTLTALQAAIEKACQKLDKALTDLKKGLDIAVQVNEALALISKALV
jgi:recombinational DNA repair ATPase RecF